MSDTQDAKENLLNALVRELERVKDENEQLRAEMREPNPLTMRLEEVSRKLSDAKNETAGLRNIIRSSQENESRRIDELESECGTLKADLESARASADELRAELEKERRHAENLGATVAKLRRVIVAGLDAMQSLSSYSSDMAQAFGLASTMGNVGRTAEDVAEACEAIEKTVGKA